MCEILGLRAVLVRKQSSSGKASHPRDKFSPLVDRRVRWWRNDSSMSQNGVGFESIRTDIHDDYRNRWPNMSGTDVNSVRTGTTDCGRLTRHKSRFICCLRVVLSGLRAIMCTKNWDIAKCVCTLGIKMSGGIKGKSSIFMVTSDKTWLVVNRCECKAWCLRRWNF